MNIKIYTIIIISLLIGSVLYINVINNYKDVTKVNITNTIKFVSCIILSMSLVSIFIVCLSSITNIIPFKYRLL